MQIRSEVFAQTNRQTNNDENITSLTNVNVIDRILSFRDRQRLAEFTEAC